MVHGAAVSLFPQVRRVKGVLASNLLPKYLRLPLPALTALSCHRFLLPLFTTLSSLKELSTSIDSDVAAAVLRNSHTSLTSLTLCMKCSFKSTFSSVNSLHLPQLTTLNLLFPDPLYVLG